MQLTRPLIALLFLVAVLFSFASPALAASPGLVIVGWGDTLYSIATQNGTTVDALILANSLPDATHFWVGQRLVIPDSSSVTQPASAVGGIYAVQRGDTLASIAARFASTEEVLVRANALEGADSIWVGQRLNIPGRTLSAALLPGMAPVVPSYNPAPAPTEGKWMDVDLSMQTITAFEGTTPLKTVLVSTGLPNHPTPIGTFAVYLKVASQTMSGGVGAERYVLPGVPWIMYFVGGNAVHGTYWHTDFGRPKSHGCVNLTIPDAKWFYDWAPMGTPVVVHP